MTDSRVETITSVGIDIGTATTQLVISRLTVVNVSPLTSIPHMEIQKREILYRSKIYCTPLLDHELIDAEKLPLIIEKEYQAAGVTAEMIQTGAAIITGETARKENARAVLNYLTDYAGSFVVATAGPHLESIFAGKGSGAAAYSQEKHLVAVNVDVGGGTTNIAVFQEGKKVDTACLNIGGRLLEIASSSSRLDYVAQPMQVLFENCGLQLKVGEEAQMTDLKKICQVMSQCVVELLSGQLSELTNKLLVTNPLKSDYKEAIIMFSGGVADYVYKEKMPQTLAEVTSYGDIGPLLGWFLRETCKKKGFALVKPRETIRATVIGAGTQAVDISGSTIQVNPTTLPLKNILVLSPFSLSVPEDSQEIAKAIEEELLLLHQDGTDQTVALFLKGPRTAMFQDIRRLAKGIAQSMAAYLTKNRPLVVVLKDDCGKVLGQCLQRILGKDEQIICIDQLSLDNGDYIDIGEPIMNGSVVPVVVKTLVFGNI